MNCDVERKSRILASGRTSELRGIFSRGSVSGPAPAIGLIAGVIDAITPSAALVCYGAPVSSLDAPFAEIPPR